MEVTNEFNNPVLSGVIHVNRSPLLDEDYPSLLFPIIQNVALNFFF